MSDSREMLRNGDDDLLAEIGDGLAVEPSTGFREGVQHRIAASASRARFPGAAWWQVVGLAAGVAVVVALAMQFGTADSGPALEPKPSLGPIAARAAETPAAASIAPSLAPTSAGVAAAPAPRVRAASRPGQAGAVHLPEGNEVRSAGPDLVVLTNQPALLRRMWADLAGGVVESIDAGRPSLSPSTGVEPQLSIPELTVAPIVIPDVTVQTAPVAGAGGAGVRRVISAEQSARSRE